MSPHAKPPPPLNVAGGGGGVVVAVAFVVAGLSACPASPELSPFAIACDEGRCPIGLMCRASPEDASVERCLPPRPAGERGETCELPIAAIGGDGDLVVLEQNITFGRATADEAIACVDGADGEGTDVVIAFTLAEDAGLQFTAPPGVALGLRRGGCGESVRFGCARPGETAVVATAAAGDYELVVKALGDDPQRGALEEVATRLRVERVDCPLGGVPHDEGRCVVARELPPLLRPRLEHTAHAFGDGRLVVAGGENGEAREFTIETFDPATARWQLANIEPGRRGHSSAVLPGNFLVAVGGTEAQDNIELSEVALDFIDSPQAHNRIDRVSSLGVGANSKTISIPMPSGELVVLSSVFAESGVYSLDGSARRTCGSDSQCRRGESCVAREPESSGVQAGVCVCTAADCADRDWARIDRIDLPTVGPQTRAGVFGESALVVGAVDDAPFIVVVLRGQPAVRRFAGTKRDHAAVVALDARRFWVLGGVDEDGEPTDLIEEFDIAFGRAEALPFRLPRPMGRPDAARLGDGVVVFDDSDEPVLLNLNGERMPVPLIPPGDGAVVTAAASGTEVYLLGGKGGRSALALEVVDKDLALGPPPPLCTQLLLPEDGVLVGDTRNSIDTFRSERCEDTFFSYGRDDLYAFTITEPTSLRVVNFDFDDPSGTAGYRLRLLRGSCLEAQELACGDGEDAIALFVGELEPGDYLLVVDYAGFNGLFDDDAPHGGSAYSARVLLGPPLACPLDELDPDDDTPEGATFITAPTDVEGNIFDEGTLCPGDIDHRLITHWDDDTDVVVTSVPAEGQRFQRASIDVDESVAAGVPVVSAVSGPLLESLDGAPAGYYVLRLDPGDDAVDFISWELFYTTDCRPEAGDVLLPELDNRVLSRARTIGPGTGADAVFCVESDVDAFILEPDLAAGNPRLGISEVGMDIEVFAIDGDTLGAAVPFTRDDDGFDETISFGQLDGPVFVTVAPGAAGLTDYRINLVQDQAGDACDNALPLRADIVEVSGVLSGDITPYNNDHDAELVGDCTGFRTPGKDIVFRFGLEVGQRLQVQGTSEVGDIALYILDACPAEATSCVAGVDDNNRGEAETLDFTAASAGEFFLVVDSFFGDDWSWDLSWSISAP
jgi:hypothetical protein